MNQADMILAGPTLTRLSVWGLEDMSVHNPLFKECIELYNRCQESLYCRAVLAIYDSEHKDDFKIVGDIFNSKDRIKTLLAFQAHLLKRNELLTRLLEYVSSETER